MYRTAGISDKLGTLYTWAIPKKRKKGRESEKPVYNILDGIFELLLVNARHIKQVPGRKTDVSDCQWIAQLLQYGLLRGRFVPDRPQRDEAHAPARGVRRRPAEDLPDRVNEAGVGQ